MGVVWRSTTPMKTDFPLQKCEKGRDFRAGVVSNIEGNLYESPVAALTDRRFRAATYFRRGFRANSDNSKAEHDRTTA